jgi:hypothetical protein
MSKTLGERSRSGSRSRRTKLKFYFEFEKLSFEIVSTTRYFIQHKKSFFSSLITGKYIWKLNLIFIYLRYFFVFVYKKNSIHIDALVWYVFLTYLFLKITVNIYHKQTIFLCYASIWNVLWAHLFEQISNHICYIQIIFRHELAYVDLKYLAH